MKCYLDWHSNSYDCKSFNFPTPLRQSQVPQRTTEHRDVCSDAAWDSAVPRPCLTGQDEGAQQLCGCSKAVSRGSTSGTAGGRVGARNWRRTDGNMSPSPAHDLYLESAC